MHEKYRKWRLSTRVYGTIYPLVRVFLIVASGLVAAKETLLQSPAASLIEWIPVFAFSVTVVTSMDTWIRPRHKWRGFMQDRDELMHLIHRASGSAMAGPEREAGVDALAELRRRHHDKNVF